MQAIYLTIGHNVNNEHTHETEEVIEAVCKTLQLEAFTAIPCFGRWDGKNEKSTRIEICNLNKQEAARIKSLIPDLADALKQQEIMFEQKTQAVEFIERKETETTTKNA